MKKSLIASAVAAGMLGAGAASADPTVYGILHLSIDTYSDPHCSSIDGAGNCATVIKADSPNMVSHTSAIGIKGSEDLGNGLKAIYKVEFQVAPDERNANGALTDRDQWIGLKGGWGSVKFGSMSNNYKQMGGKVDPLYRTEAEGRGILNMQSGLHGGAGNSGGRSTNTVQYASPKMGGAQLVANYTFSGAGTLADTDETLGIGVRWSSKQILAYFDYLKPGKNNPSNAADETAMKLGGKFSTDMFSVALQYEMLEDLFCQKAAGCSGGDYIFAAGTYNINKNNVVALTLGQQDKVSQSWALAYVHMLSKQTNVYVGYGSVEADSCTGSGTGKSCSYGLGTDGQGTAQDKGSVITLGMRKSF